MQPLCLTLDFSCTQGGQFLASPRSPCTASIYAKLELQVSKAAAGSLAPWELAEAAMWPEYLEALIW